MRVNLFPCTKCSIYSGWSSVIGTGKILSYMNISRFASLDNYISEAMNATSGNRFRFSVKNGYVSKLLTWPEANTHLDEVFSINTSLKFRQGKPMSESYTKRPTPQSGIAICEQHRESFIGTFDASGKLIAYIVMHFCGEISAASMIMCHADHMKPGAMLNTWVKFIELSRNAGKKYAVYGHWADGRDGLRHWKKSVGLAPTIMEEIK